MSAFAAALATLHADPNLGTDAEWRAAAGGPWKPLRVVVNQPADVVPGLRGGSARAVTSEITVLATEMAPDAPRRGDLVRRLSPLTIWKVEEVEPDALGLSWRLGLAATA